MKILVEGGDNLYATSCTCDCACNCDCFGNHLCFKGCGMQYTCRYIET